MHQFCPVLVVRSLPRLKGRGLKVPLLMGCVKKAKAGLRTVHGRKERLLSVWMVVCAGCQFFARLEPWGGPWVPGFLELP